MLETYVEGFGRSDEGQHVRNLFFPHSRSPLKWGQCHYNVIFIVAVVVSLY